MEFKDYLQSLSVIILFFVILWGAYYATKYIGKLQFKRTNGNNMSIVEVLPVGPQKTVQLIRVGTEYMVIGVSKDHISFIQGVDESTIKLEKDQSEMVIPFSAYMKKLVKKDQTDQTKIGEDTDEDEE
jgi:flagellar protein FliO/FliZ